MEYIKVGVGLPVPFNIVPNSNAVRYVRETVSNLFKRLSGKKGGNSNSSRNKLPSSNGHSLGLAAVTAIGVGGRRNNIVTDMQMNEQAAYGGARTRRETMDISTIELRNVLFIVLLRVLSVC